MYGGKVNKIDLRNKSFGRLVVLNEDGRSADGHVKWLVASVELQVGGKIDTLRERKGMGLVLSDYKTSKSIYMEQLLQVIGGYRRMFREWRNIRIPYVEIVTFPKLAENEMHILLADENGWVKDGVRTDVPELFVKIEQQFERNVGTFNFRNEVDDLLFPSKKD